MAHTFNFSTWEVEAGRSGLHEFNQSKRETELRPLIPALGSHVFDPSTWEAHAFNPNTREVEIGSNVAGWREKYKAGGDRRSPPLI